MGASCPHCSKEVTGWIPEDRLSKMAADKREALAELEALKAQAQTLQSKAEQVEALTAELSEARTHAANLSTQHSRQLDVYRHGVTDSEDVADLLAIYERRAPDGVSLGDWLGNRDELPKAVSALLAASQAEAGSMPPPPVEAAPVTAPQAAPNGAEVAPPNPTISATAPAAAPVSANAGAVVTPPARAMPSAADIASMSIDEYKVHRDTLIAGLTQQRGL